MASLYELTGSYSALLDLADSADPADQQAFSDTLEGLAGDIESKLLSCCAVVRSLESQADAVEAEEKRLAARRKSLMASRDRLKAYMFDSMERVGMTKVKGNLFSLGIQNNAPSVVLDGGLDVATLPEKYKRVTVEANKTAIKYDLNAGVKVKGASLVVTRSLRIR